MNYAKTKPKLTNLAYSYLGRFAELASAHERQSYISRHLSGDLMIDERQAIMEVYKGCKVSQADSTTADLIREFEKPNYRQITKG